MKQDYAVGPDCDHLCHARVGVVVTGEHIGTIVNRGAGKEIIDMGVREPIGVGSVEVDPRGPTRASPQCP